MSLSQLVRRYFVPAALVVGMLGCSSEKDPCRDGRIYQEGIGCVEESNVDTPYDAGPSIDAFVAEDTSVALKVDSYVPKEKDTYVPPKDIGSKCTEEKFYFDKDGDGHGTSDYKWLCEPWHEYTADNSGDCDDDNKDIHPGATEYCNSLDDDCDGKKDENFSNLGTDCSSNYGVCKEKGIVVCKDKYNAGCNAPSPTYSEEVCDNKDNNCDGSTDEGLYKKDWDCPKKDSMCIEGKWICL
ncbi:hypothetical protein HOD05_04350 [Candidatus Woesearchaeota archaeon]|jgi:hypothetical protein|nr:hypothetical protein [Candidatus Woesearchaeota archaeon]MBT4151200.1 hypothetical protein [Candidatus Woesearchaeota archaeon]MBT4434425.1 hypothetical protein [Candidatus Woesearchaeota archaeon]